MGYNLHERFEVKRINHQEAYSLDGACTNMAEEYFSGLRRAEIGIRHHIAGAYLLRYAQEPWWREDNRKVSNGDQVNDAGLLDHSQRHTDSSSIVRTRIQITNSLVVSRKETMAPNVNSSTWQCYFDRPASSICKNGSGVRCLSAR
jgi:ISXO2-like transposase domain